MYIYILRNNGIEFSNIHYRPWAMGSETFMNPKAIKKKKTTDTYSHNSKITENHKKEKI